MENSASIKQTHDSVMHESKSLNTTSDSTCVTDRSFGDTLKTSVEDKHEVTLPAPPARLYVLADEQIEAYELDLWDRFDGITDVEDISQLDCRLVESRLCVIDRRERYAKSQIVEVDHDQLDQIQFLMDEAAIHKEDLEQCLGKINAMRREVEGRVRILADEMAQLKTDRFMCTRGLQTREDEATTCLRKLLATIEKLSQPATKIPMPIVETNKSLCGDFIFSKQMDQKNAFDDIKRNKPHSKDKNKDIPSQVTKIGFKDVKSKLNTGRQNRHTSIERHVRDRVEHTEEKAPLERQVRWNDEVEQTVHNKQTVGVCSEDKKVRRKREIKSKLDTGRKKSVGRKAAVNDVVLNLADIKAHSEGNSSFVHKQPLPKIKSIAKKKATTKDHNLTLNRNGNNNMRTPLPELKCRGRHGSSTINTSSSAHGAFSPLWIGSARSTPLPPIKSAREDKLNTETKSDAYTEVERNAGLSWVTRLLSPLPDNAERLD